MIVRDRFYQKRSMQRPFFDSAVLSSRPIERVWGVDGTLIFWLVEWAPDEIERRGHLDTLDGYPSHIADSCLSRRAEHHFGRRAATAALRELGPCDADFNSVGVGRFGEPMWPIGIVGSISHCDHAAIAAVARRSQYSGVGVDIEIVVSVEQAATLARTVVNERETLVLTESTCSSWDTCTLTTLTFSAKESLYKSVFPFVRSTFDFLAASRLVTIDLGRQELDLELANSPCSDRGIRSRYRVRFGRLADDLVFTHLTW